MSESSSEAPSVIEISDADMAAAAAEETAGEGAEAVEETGGPFSQKTAWVRRMETPLRNFLRTETGSASVLAAATVLALIWANVSFSAYEKFWGTRLSVFVDGFTLACIEQVCSDEIIPAGQIFDILEGLVEKSVVSTHDAPAAVFNKALSSGQSATASLPSFMLSVSR